MTLVAGSLGGRHADGGPMALVGSSPGELKAAPPDDASLLSIFGDGDRLQRRRSVSNASRRAGVAMAPSDAGCAAVQMDLFYIESLALDLYTLLQTLGVVLRSRGAY